MRPYEVFNRFLTLAALAGGLLLGLALAHDTSRLAADAAAPALAGALADAGSAGAELVGSAVVSDGPDPLSSTTLVLAGRGERARRGATTDVWVHDGFAYLGTFGTPCGDGEVGPAGVQIFDVHDPTRPELVGALPSVAGSRVNDVKVMTMVGGERLVHSNEPCRGGPGGFELYDVSDPLAAVHLAHVSTASINPDVRRDEGEVGVHNLVLFSREGRDYAAAQVETLIGGFQIFDLTDPLNVKLVGHYGAESVRWPDVDWRSVSDPALLDEAEVYLRSGFGQMANRLLHDHYVTPDGLTAYLASWDAGLLRLDLSDLNRPRLVSVALSPGSEDGEVNSHSVWPSADGLVVVEGEEDFDPFGLQLRLLDGPMAASFPATEGRFTAPLADLADGVLSGTTVYLGLGCEALDPSGEEGAVALFQRGVCTFETKLANAVAADYRAAVVFNTDEGGAALLQMGGDAPSPIPALFVGHATGLALAGATTDETVADLAVGEPGGRIRASVQANGWSGLRIWDYSDPERPVLASTFNTRCSAEPAGERCADGVYSSHNLVVENERAYVSWYAEGVLILDLSDPYAPRELARYHESGSKFEAQNAGPQDVWGVHKLPGEPWIYTSDRNGGLYVLREETTRAR